MPKNGVLPKTRHCLIFFWGPRNVLCLLFGGFFYMYLVMLYILSSSENHAMPQYDFCIIKIDLWKLEHFLAQQPRIFNWIITSFTQINTQKKDGKKNFKHLYLFQTKTPSQLRIPASPKPTRPFIPMQKKKTPNRKSSSQSVQHGRNKLPQSYRVVSGRFPLYTAP